jgi:hypothetical protein
MPEHDVIKSQPFDAPFVRVRGRLSRQGVVTWSPCFRTFHPPSWVTTTPGHEPPHNIAAGGPAEVEAALQGGVPNPHYHAIVAAQQAASAQNPDVPRDPTGDPSGASQVVVPENGDGYVVAFEDAQGKVLAHAPVRIRFFAVDRQWALFTQRLPYRRDTHRVVLRRGERELGALVVPKHLPEFLLTHPLKSDEVDVHGVLHLRWELAKSEEAEAKKAPLTYYVRYSADRRQWYRPGVNITDTLFDLDLREMPGGERCVAQVIATNGYQTSYVETPPFSVPRKSPEILLATPGGPLLFAQGFSREEGPLVGESIEWLVDGKRPIGTGASFDARRLGGRVRQMAVRVTDSRGMVTIQHLGWYNGETGLQVTPRAGY